MFRTQSKETYESGLYTTVGMDIVVTAERVILIDTQVSLQLYQQHEALVLIRQAYMYVSMIKLVDALMPTCLSICLPLSLSLSPSLFTAYFKRGNTGAVPREQELCPPGNDTRQISWSYGRANF